MIQIIYVFNIKILNEIPCNNNIIIKYSSYSVRQLERKRVVVVIIVVVKYLLVSYLYLGRGL